MSTQAERMANFCQVSVAVDPHVKDQLVSLSSKLGVSQSELGRQLFQRALQGLPAEETFNELERTGKPEHPQRKWEIRAVPESVEVGNFIRWIMNDASLADVQVLDVCLDIRRREFG